MRIQKQLSQIKTNDYGAFLSVIEENELKRTFSKSTDADLSLSG